MSEKIKCLRVPPELSDGEHWTIEEFPMSELAERNIAHLLSEWLESAEPGETAEFGVLYMTRKEIEDLPDL